MNNVISNLTQKKSLTLLLLTHLKRIENLS